MSGSLALVTGASTGIGAAFARQLAARGDDLVVVARDRSRLDALAAELRGKHGTSVEVLAADLCAPDQLAEVEARLAATDRQPVSTLVNNAGYAVGGPFLGTGRDDLVGQVDLNITALVTLSRAVIPGMVERGRGGILNVASIGAFQPGPQFAVYSATKSFVLQFSEALHVELASSGVAVCVLCPGFTRTGFQAKAGLGASRTPDFLWQTPERVAADGLAALDAGEALCVPGVINKVASFLPRLLPRSVMRTMAGKAAETM